MGNLTLSLASGLLAVCLLGCADDDCRIVCEKNAECDPDSPGEDACVELCEELSEDEAYADALSEQADCYEDESCQSIAGGACNPDFS